jgi:Cu/Zn superoxide dismutase
VRKLVALLSLGAVTALAVTAVSLAATHGAGWSTKLTAAQEVPKQVVADTAAGGSFTATLTGKTLKWKLSFSKLTGPATAAHIHLGGMGKAGNVVVPLCGPCKSGMTGTATISAALMKDFTKHLLYVNVHTAKNPNGEIRGQLGG